MADRLPDHDETEIETDSKPTAPGSSSKFAFKKPVIIAAAAIAVILLAAGGAWLSGALDPVVAMVTGSEEPASHEAAAPPQVVFFELPDLVITLANADQKPSYLKVRVSVELASSQDIPRVERLKPRVIDAVQVYLRELRRDDLLGAAGTLRLRHELRKRIALAVAPTPVNDVLFADLLIQ
jgi:flagellar FliL protein